MKGDALAGALVAIVLSSCASSVRADSEAQGGEKLSLCLITEDTKMFLDTEVSVSARYVSDSRHEEVLEAVCKGQRNILDIGRRSKDPSVVEFYKERRSVCAERGSDYLCNVEADVEMIGTVEVMSGDYVFGIKEVKSFKFRD